MGVKLETDRVHVLDETVDTGPGAMEEFTRSLQVSPEVHELDESINTGPNAMAELIASFKTSQTEMAAIRQSQIEEIRKLEGDVAEAGEYGTLHITDHGRTLTVDLGKPGETIATAHEEPRARFEFQKDQFGNLGGMTATVNDLTLGDDPSEILGDVLHAALHAIDRRGY